MGNAHNSKGPGDDAKRRRTKVYVSFFDLASRDGINMAEPMSPELRAELMKQCEAFCQPSRHDAHYSKYRLRSERRARSSPT